jgi:hypothetical protein
LSFKQGYSFLLHLFTYSQIVKKINLKMTFPILSQSISLLCKMWYPITYTKLENVFFP